MTWDENAVTIFNVTLYLQLEFGLDAEKERRRARRRKHLTEAEELRAFAFEDDE